MIKFLILSSYDVENPSQCFKTVGKWMKRTMILLWSKGNWDYFGQYRILYEGRFLMCVAACRSGETLQGHSFGLIWDSITLNHQQQSRKRASLGMLQTLEHQCSTWMEAMIPQRVWPQSLHPVVPQTQTGRGAPQNELI